MSEGLGKGCYVKNDSGILNEFILRNITFVLSVNIFQNRLFLLKKAKIV